MLLLPHEVFSPPVFLCKSFALIPSKSMSLTAGGVCNSIFPSFTKPPSTTRPQNRASTSSLLCWASFCPSLAPDKSLVGFGISAYPPSSSGFLPPFAENVLRSWPFLIASPVFLAVGSGLLYSLETTTSSAKMVGLQILVGMGVGLGMQNALVAAVSSPKISRWCSSR